MYFFEYYPKCFQSSSINMVKKRQTNIVNIKVIIECI